MQFTVYRPTGINEGKPILRAYEAVISTIEGKHMLTIRNAGGAGAHWVQTFGDGSAPGAAAYDAAVSAMADDGFTPIRALAERYTVWMTTACGVAAKNATGVPACSFADLAAAYVNDCDEDVHFESERIGKSIAAALRIVFSDNGKGE